MSDKIIITRDAEAKVIKTQMTTYAAGCHYDRALEINTIKLKIAYPWLPDEVVRDEIELTIAQEEFEKLRKFKKFQITIEGIK